MRVFLILFSLVVFMFGSSVEAFDGQRGNSTYSEFNKVKKIMSKYVFPLHMETIYCRAPIKRNKEVEIPEGFTSRAHQARNSRYEIEHVVPVEHFGRSFPEWRYGDSRCVDKKGRRFKGRNCAQKESLEFRYMQSDMYNLYPAIGSVNATRGHKDFDLLENEKSSFGTCEMKVGKDKVEPPAYSRGVIARTYLYMQYAYSPRFRMSKSQERLMNAWDNQHPVAKWECKRAKKIEELQGNENPFVKGPCIERGMYQ